MAKKDLGALVQSIGAPQPAPAAVQEETPTTQAQAEKPAAAAQVPEAPAKPVKAPAPVPTRKPAPEADAVGEEPITTDATATAGVQVMIPPELNARLQAYLKKRNISHGKFLIEAIEKTYKRLPQLIAEAQGQEDEEEDDDRVFLFERPARERQQASTGARAKHHVRVTPKNRKLLDTITEQVEAPSRNFMISTAYDAYLPHLDNES